MRPGILALTNTSLASTVPISFRSPEVRAVSKYHTSDPRVSSPRIMKTLFLAFIGSPKKVPRCRQFRHWSVSEYACRQFSAMGAIHKDRLAQELDDRTPTCF